MNQHGIITKSRTNMRRRMYLVHRNAQSLCAQGIAADRRQVSVRFRAFE
jgi:hypothetical protein